MILVIGGTGHVGSEVVAALRTRGEPFKVMSRDRRRAHERLGDVEVVEGDFDRPETLDAPMRGVDRVFLLTPGAPEQVAQEGAVVDAAIRAGVSHIVKQSVCGASLDSTSILVRWHGQSERLIEASGIAWTFLRPTLFMQMTTLLRAPDGNVYTVVGDGRIAFVDTRDIAAVAAEALTRPHHEGRVYMPTGPEALTWDEAAERLSRGGLPTRHVRVTEETSRQSMAGRMPEWRVRPTIELNRQIAAGLYEMVTQDVQTVTGRPPRSLDDYVRELAAAA
jgi:uncharacterized protein YbjT (DUF2867 family)